MGWEVKVPLHMTYSKGFYFFAGAGTALASTNYDCAPSNAVSGCTVSTTNSICYCMPDLCNTSAGPPTQSFDLFFIVFAAISTLMVSMKLI